MVDKHNGKATASLVLGIISLITWLIPLFGYPVSIVGLIMGFYGIKSEKKSLGTAKPSRSYKPGKGRNGINRFCLLKLLSFKAKYHLNQVIKRAFVFQRTDKADVIHKGYNSFCLLRIPHFLFGNIAEFTFFGIGYVFKVLV